MVWGGMGVFYRFQPANIYELACCYLEIVYKLNATQHSNRFISLFLAKISPRDGVTLHINSLNNRIFGLFRHGYRKSNSFGVQEHITYVRMYAIKCGDEN
jgi:hypothetical protein